MGAVAIATVIVKVVGCYLAAGVLFALPFVLWGAGRIDPAAREVTPGFRLLIFPGSVALWPLLLKRWLSGQHTPPPECNAHRRAVMEKTP